ncbi:hypothetical protein AB0J80_08620 [Actinoplanes sp. NPDC049548]|uniref:hypothetical protein n=1 Tax=Actinoplanes sp. NPDC049548 TaxID=3155152 RepID=UPI00342FBC4A
MADPDVLTLERLSTGLFVEYLSATTTDPDLLVVGLDYPAPVCDRLWQGHPGVIHDPTAQHVQVTWAGLEDTVASFGLGFSCDDQGRYGLGIISATEYAARRLRVLAGRSPTG